MCCSCGLAVCSSVCVLGWIALGVILSISVWYLWVFVYVTDFASECVVSRQQVNKQYRLNEQWLASTWSQKAPACSVTSRVLARTDCTLTELEPQPSCESVWHRSVKLYLKSWSQRGRSRSEAVQRHVVNWFYWRIDFHQEKETQDAAAVIFLSGQPDLPEKWNPGQKSLQLTHRCLLKLIVFQLHLFQVYLQAVQCWLHRVTKKDRMSLPSLSFRECIQLKPNNKVIVSDYY